MRRKMTPKIYYVGFPAQMMTHRELVPFEVLEETDTTLRIKLLGDCPTLEGITEEDLPKAGDEFRIKNTYRTNGQEVKLTDYLRAGRFAPWYRCGEKEGEGVDYFSGAIFPADHTKNK